ncbi:MAG: hypothetical protein INR71_08630, partial [Terriglobus roseus]|nr:hypothetical protein [Terriglobus roseus]
MASLSQQLPADGLAGGKEQWHDSGVGSDDEDHQTQDELAAEKERLYRPNDVEAQLPPPPPAAVAKPDTGLEYEVSARTKLIYLGVYFFFNLALTIYNKAVL